MNRLTFSESNASQQYATHNYFRYFGKLPPVVVKHILETGCVRGEPFADLMCGSGTSLVEANFLGIDATGIDVNPLSTLLSRVKTTVLPQDELRTAIDELSAIIQRDMICLTSLEDLDTLPKQLRYIQDQRPSFRNKEYWFSALNEYALIVIKHYIDRVQDVHYREFFLVAFFSIIRRASNASPRTGRIFRVADPKPVDVYKLFSKRLAEMTEGMKELHARATEAKVTVLQSDARKTKLLSDHFGFVLNHPPYFALYKYSSDVLRFELEWGNFDRTPIVQGEIRDGFKTTDPMMLDAYVADMKSLFLEAYRILKADRCFCLVVNDSTLKNIQLPVIDRLTQAAKEVGFRIDEHFVRDVLFSQARYHQSADASIQTKEDHMIFFRK